MKPLRLGIFLVCIGLQSVSVRADLSLSSLLPKACYSVGDFWQEKSIPGMPTLLRSSGRYAFDCQRGVIWLQQKPLIEGFLFATDQSYFAINPEGELQPLAARYQNAIGRLMLMLFAAKEQEIERYFSISVANNNPLTFELVPKQRRLKKAIQSIFIVQGEAGRDDGAIGGVEISMVDSVGQTLRIVNQSARDFEQASDLQAQCQVWLGPLAQTSCAQLGQVPALN